MKSIEDYSKERIEKALKVKIENYNARLIGLSSIERRYTKQGEQFKNLKNNFNDVLHFENSCLGLDVYFYTQYQNYNIEYDEIKYNNYNKEYIFMMGVASKINVFMIEEKIELLRTQTLEYIKEIENILNSSIIDEISQTFETLKNQYKSTKNTPLFYVLWDLLGYVKGC